MQEKELTGTVSEMRNVQPFLFTESQYSKYCKGFSYSFLIEERAIIFPKKESLAALKPAEAQIFSRLFFAALTSHYCLHHNKITMLKLCRGREEHGREILTFASLVLALTVSETRERELGRYRMKSGYSELEWNRKMVEGDKNGEGTLNFYPTKIRASY